MKEKSKKMQIIIWGLSLLPMLIVAVFYGRLPEQIPTNWGFDGNVTYGSKLTIWMLAGMPVLFGVMFYVLPFIDPKKRSYEKFHPAYLFFQVVMQLFLLVLTCIVLTESLKPGTVNVATLTCAMCGIIYIVTGNIMPKFRQNFFCGFKTPWTLSNEVVWTKTNRLGGRMLFGAGVLGLLGAFIPDDKWKIGFLLVPSLVAAIVPSVMSFIWFRQMTKEEQ